MTILTPERAVKQATGITIIGVCFILLPVIIFNISIIFSIETADRIIASIISSWHIFFFIGGLFTAVGIAAWVSVIVEIKAEAATTTLKVFGVEIPFRVEGFAFVFLLLVVIGGVSINVLNLTTIEPPSKLYESINMDIKAKDKLITTANKEIAALMAVKIRYNTLQKILISQFEGKSLPLLVNVNCGNKNKNDLRKVRLEYRVKGGGYEALVPGVELESSAREPLHITPKIPEFIYLGPDQNETNTYALTLELHSIDENIVLTLWPETTSLLDLCNPKARELADGETSRSRGEKFPSRGKAINVDLE